MKGRVVRKASGLASDTSSMAWSRYPLPPFRTGAQTVPHPLSASRKAGRRSVAILKVCIEVMLSELVGASTNSEESMGLTVGLFK